MSCAFSHVVRFVLLLLKRLPDSPHLVSQLGYCLLLNFNFLLNLDLVAVSTAFGSCSVAMCRGLSVSLSLVIGPTSLFEKLFSSYVSACSWHCSVCSIDFHLLLAVLFSAALGCALLLAVGYALLLAVGYALLPAVGYSVLPAVVQLSEVLVDLLLVVVQALRLCAPFSVIWLCLFR